MRNAAYPIGPWPLGGLSQQREPFVRIRQTLKVTPAMAAAVTSRICEMGRRVRLAEV